MKLLPCHDLSSKKAVLERTIKTPLDIIARQCVLVWQDCAKLTAILETSFDSLANCHLLYAIDVAGVQRSNSVSAKGAEETKYGQYHANQPALQGQLPYRGLVLSEAFVYEQTRETCISAIQAVIVNEELLGFVVAEFELSRLPSVFSNDDNDRRDISPWLQYRGDPAIRSTVFTQQRYFSHLDRNVAEINQTLTRLMVSHGAFHVKIHYSSSRCTVWSVKNPYGYQLYNHDEILKPEFLHIYSPQYYSRKAVVHKSKVSKVLEQFRQLREGDDMFYLRSASLNIMNGLVGLTFSCDGSHYLSADDFLNLNLNFWYGTKASA